ncbi:N-acetylglucosamine kinase [Paenibacillus montanisoli]|uniref:ATPase n=1 Tax=Paenibacillus montanisoli TaxID=2081970 RepID=A0A328UE72_9BACL|nr:BadF/BadG/BcrA/BcrD ATPase family protein [Paenibacillus montanisoli]RAP78246.1 ATPase [Paenibacillus montanisoli]
MAERIVIGIDGGGTTTRIMAVDPQGRMLAYAEEGSSNPDKDPNAKEHVQEGIRKALSEANVDSGDVIALCAGFAGFDNDDDSSWAAEFTALPGLSCPKVLVNDAVVAHAGALMNQPGIVAISGTGSTIFGVNEDGRHLCNYDFHHYAPTAARFLAYDAVYQIIAGNIGEQDESFVQAALDYWNVASISELAMVGASGFIADYVERTLKFGRMGPMVTAAAREGCPVAQNVCGTAVTALNDGIRLLGRCFASDVVNVALIGSVARDPYVQAKLEQALSHPTNKSYRVVEPALPPAAGAILMAMEKAGISAGSQFIEQLKNQIPA